MPFMDFKNPQTVQFATALFINCGERSLNYNFRNVGLRS